ncbi:hypothetical protein S58_51470 [Bradyrhizobium oligotrophicum S58]|uniref:Uncharacterized protein n=1 Tax=Bradyrhizobium oligotrophicum S58 TaxID=1245469 RepID=M4ZCE8_9BRAD|nr:hypothetical protein S58_51470 [Bradyrhizobium oligotrophicum S58]
MCRRAASTVCGRSIAGARGGVRNGAAVAAVHITVSIGERRACAKRMVRRVRFPDRLRRPRGAYTLLSVMAAYTIVRSSRRIG